MSALPELDKNIHLLHGTTPPPLAPEEMMVILIVQNGEHQIESFIEHHLNLGARHIVVLDNGSTDRTVELSSKHDNISVFSSTLPYEKWEHLLKAWSGFRFSSNGWILFADVDERFDYPESDQVSLHSFLKYLNQNSYSVVQARMLDLFSLDPASLWPEGGAELEKKSIWYDLTDIEWKSSRKKQREAFGGIRNPAFGISPKVTKYPLLRWRSGGWPSLKSSHAYATGHPADLITLLRHYKFDRSFTQQCADAVKRENHWNNSLEYKHYLKAMENSSDFRFTPKNPRKLDRLDQLIHEGFLDISDRYRKYALSTVK